MKCFLLAIVTTLPLLGAEIAQAPNPLKVVVFPGGQAWPLWVAEDKGMFARERLAVDTTLTPGSVFMMTGLIAGRFDVAITNIDNVIAYDEGQGEIAVDGQPDLFSFMGGNNGFLTLYVSPEIEGYSGLRGKRLAVDAVNTGYAFVLREMLARNGVGATDYRLEPVGGTALRWAALRQHQYAGTLLNPHFDAVASAEGFRLVARAIDVLHRYQGVVGCASRSWARDHDTDLVGFIRAYAASIRWLTDPANKTAALELFRRHMPDISGDIASATYDEEVVSSGGFDASLALDVEGIRTVLALRRKYGQPPKELSDPTHYYDLSYYNRAQTKQ